VTEVFGEVGGGQLEVLSEDECLRLMPLAGVGRLAFPAEAFPVVVPVNYRLLVGDPGLRVVLRARPGGVIEHAVRVAFEVDGADLGHHEGWSVLVQGTLGHIDGVDLARYEQRVDPHSWVAGRSSWLIITPVAITGRRLRAPEVEWAIDVRAYL